ncbi:MAG: 5'-3' exonuclease H3TH domain-containing protein [Victivallales bacterium]|jgi:DNA polymerase-1
MNDTITLIDAYSQIYRGFYALPLLSNSKGQFTNAVLATAKFLLSLERDYPSPYGAVVFDKGRPAHRMLLAPDYKAQRPPMPQELQSQLPFIRQWIEAAGWNIVERDGTEADDIIAAIAVNFRENPVRIISADKDIAQVIDDRVKMLIPDRKLGGFLLQGSDEVFARFAVLPSQIVDYLSLIGDSSDNIPGVDGVGPKTAAKLMGQFGSLDVMLGKLSEIESEKLREKIAASVEIIRRNQKIISLDLSISDERLADINSYLKRKPDCEKLKSIASDLEMKSIVAELDRAGDKNEPEKTRQSVKGKQPIEDAMFTPDLFG